MTRTPAHAGVFQSCSIAYLNMSNTTTAARRGFPTRDGDIRYRSNLTFSDIPSPTSTLEAKPECYFPETDKHVSTTNAWRFGWCPKAYAWAAIRNEDHKHGRKAYLFRSERDCRAFHESMAGSWEWVRV